MNDIVLSYVLSVMDGIIMEVMDLGLGLALRVWTVNISMCSMAEQGS